jgi:hypothetical protein
MINHGQPVAEGFEPLPHRHLLGPLQLIKPAGFHRLKKLGVDIVEFVEDYIQPPALSSC